MEFSTVAQAQVAQERLNGKEYAEGQRIYVRQDRDDRYLVPLCGSCGKSRNPGYCGPPPLPILARLFSCVNLDVGLDSLSKLDAECAPGGCQVCATSAFP